MKALLSAFEWLRGGGAAYFPELKHGALAALASREAEVIALLSSPDRTARVGALGALSELRTRAALEALVDALEDPRLRAQARGMLSRIAGRDLGAASGNWLPWIAALKTSSETYRGNT